MSKYLKRIPAVAVALLLGVFLASGCGVDHSPMAATDEATPQPAVQAAKKAKDDTTDDGGKVTSKKGPSRYSTGGGRR